MKLGSYGWVLFRVLWLCHGLHSIPRTWRMQSTWEMLHTHFFKEHKKKVRSKRIYCLQGIKLQRNKKYLGAREMAQQLRTLTGLLGDPGSMSGSHMVAHCLFSSSSTALIRHQDIHTAKTLILRNSKINKSSFKCISVGTMQHCLFKIQEPFANFWEKVIFKLNAKFNCSFVYCFIE